MSKGIFNGERRGDKMFSFIFFILLVFLANWMMGCQSPKTFVIEKVDCRKHPDWFRCTPFIPEKDVSYEEVNEADFEVDF